MNEKSGAKPSGKVLFGVDYLTLMRFMELEDDEADKNTKTNYTDAIIRFFLLQWGFSLTEIDEANRLFFEKANNNELDPKIGTVLDRVVNFVKNDKEKQERLVIEMAAIGLIDNHVSDRESSLMNIFKDEFDLRQSEIQALVKIGSDWSAGFDFISQKYIEDNPD